MSIFVLGRERLSLRHRPLLGISALSLFFLLIAAAVSPASATCLASGKSCGVSTSSNDRLCCPGTICGPWGNVCQPGCRIGGVAYRVGTINPANICQVCRPGTSTTAWSSVTNGTACSDGNACTQTDTCQSGSCTGANLVVCSAQDQCHDAGTCNRSNGTCSNPTKANGSPCDDGNFCTQSESCLSGVCQGGSPRNCDDGVACTTDICRAGGCASIPDDTLCAAGQTCDAIAGCQASCQASGTFFIAGLCDANCTSNCSSQATTCCSGVATVSGCGSFCTCECM
jgi:hypothetical protein